ncbi:hypothetical protein E2C01_076174 [Portunus trituberculatus]|uniref:Uncharacterized protein n=1 Tax=Portunus trituberculatus TaxID=210409 RepID=A0A5B7IAQ7_PORTR|nr:hypothetical protein [Portunus trituberculatus]
MCQRYNKEERVEVQVTYKERRSGSEHGRSLVPNLGYASPPSCPLFPASLPSSTAAPPPFPPSSPTSAAAATTSRAGGQGGTDEEGQKAPVLIYIKYMKFVQ